MSTGNPKNMRQSCTRPKCVHYDHGVKRCLKGFVNPKTIRDAVQPAEMGLLKPCPWTYRGQKVIERMKIRKNNNG